MWLKKIEYHGNRWNKMLSNALYIRSDIGRSFLGGCRDRISPVNGHKPIYLFAGRLERRRDAQRLQLEIEPWKLRLLDSSSPLRNLRGGRGDWTSKGRSATSRPHLRIAFFFFLTRWEYKLKSRSSMNRMIKHSNTLLQNSFLNSSANFSVLLIRWIKL